MENSPSSVLIIDTAWIGDVIFTTALVGAVKHTWPATPIDIVVAPRGEAVLRDHHEVRNVFVYDKAGAQSSLGAMGLLAAKLNSEHYSLVLCTHPSARSRLLCMRLNAPVKIGYHGFGDRWAFTKTIAGDLAGEPDHVQRRLNLLRAAGVEIADVPPLRVDVSEENREDADARLRELGAGQPLLGLVVGSAWATKRWSASGFAETARKWFGQTGGHSLILAGEAERTLAEQILNAADGSAHALIQQPLPMLRAVFESCEAVVGNDTGLTYLAIASGCKRVIALYGSTQVNYGFPPPHQAIRAGVPCCLSRYGHGKPCCKWNDGVAWCMEQITAERVWQQLRCTE